MAYGISITKKFTWRGVDEEFSNVYHYDLGSPITTDSGWQALADAIRDIETNVFGPKVTFLRWRAWGPTYEAADETPELKNASITQGVGDLTGVGTAGGADMAGELAYVASFYIGRGPKGGKRFLRKYYHSTVLMDINASADQANGYTAISSVAKQPVIDAMNSLKTITIGGSANDLCTPGGDHLPLGSSPVVNDYLHVRQLKV